ncbi:MAG: hypothetical protein CVU11_12960 [Bacteroidetes bacterium HGW-Bacteroidetes-6]|jgi:hypothetical protein|nr:MAG: hypothetical protein CVU11_12960 [Bacteroidetes bacterium HGW-Bacteroidetes-6]
MRKSFSLWKIVLFLPIIIAFIILYPGKYPHKLVKTTGSDYLSEILEFNKPGEYLINVDEHKWPDKNVFENQLLQVSLIFEDHDKISESDFLNTPFSFVLNSQNDSDNRLMYNSEFDTNRVALKDLDAYSYDGYARKYPIGLIINFRAEDIHIKLDLVDDDSIISATKPRILLEPYKRTQTSHPVVDLIENAFFWLASICLLLIVINEIIVFVKS